MSVKNDFEGRVVETAVQQILRGYVPPIIRIGTLDFEQVPEITTLEEIADIGNIEPLAKIYYELNCSDQMMRELSIYVQVEGKSKSGSSDKPHDWKYSSPESNGARLLKILCPQQ